MRYRQRSRSSTYEDACGSDFIRRIRHRWIPEGRAQQRPHFYAARHQGDGKRKRHPEHRTAYAHRLCSPSEVALPPLVARQLPYITELTTYTRASRSTFYAV